MESLSFKDILERDVKQTFLNPEEFGEKHRVNGKTMVISFDDIENIEREKKMKSFADGIFTRQMLFYVSAADFGPFPAQGGLINIDGSNYTVVDATNEAGMYAITVEASRSSAKSRCVIK